MSSATDKSPIIQGWCPGALRPMLSGDGYVVRVRPRGGRLNPDQAAGIAALARAYGNGLIDLSARANVQLRGVTEASHPALIEGLRTLGLIDENAETEARRNIVVTPFWSADDGTQTLAAALAKALANDDAPKLPGKFGFAVDTGARPVLRGVSADIRLERGADGGLILRADGAGTGAKVTDQTAVPAALGLARWFVENGGVSEGRGRMAALIAKGAPLPPAFRYALATAEPTDRAPLPGACPQGFLASFDFGQMRGETLAALAALGALRVTPWRMLLIEGLTNAPTLPGLITAPDDPMLRVIACTGAPGCPQAHGATRPLARALATHVPQGRVLHVSGCAKRCALPGPALPATTVTLVAQPAGFALVQGGTAQDKPTLPVGLTPEALLSSPQTLFGTR